MYSYSFWSSPTRPLLEDCGLEESIRQSILVILSTEKGERDLLPDFGSNLYQFVFRRLEAGVLNEVEEEARRCLEQWEPRVQIESIKARPLASSPNQVNLLIRYSVKSTGSKQSINYALNFFEY